MGPRNARTDKPLEVTDSLGRRWPIGEALKAMDRKLRRRLGLPFDPDVAQSSFETYCKKHFIEHGKHFNPGETRAANAVIAKHSAPTSNLIAPTFDPQTAAATFESNLRLVSQDLETIRSRMQSMDVEALRELSHVMNDVLSNYKDLERLELQYMSATEYEAILDEESDSKGARAALSVGNYFLECGHLTEPKQLAVAQWLSECAQDEFDRILASIAEAHGIRMEVKVMLSGRDWALAALYLEDDRRWIPLTRKSFDFNVITGMMMGVLAGKGLSTCSCAKECASLLLPMETVGMSHGVVAMAISKLKTEAEKPQLPLGRPGLAEG